MKKRLLLIGVLLTFMLTEAGAVLKEKDLQQTLAILKTELLRYNNELKERTQVRKQHNKRIIQELVSTMKRADQNALMLYSQQQENVFDLTYACHEATEQYHEFHSRQLPFKTFLSHNQRDIARYDSLINSLKVMPDKVLGKEGVQKRDSCVMLAENIRGLLQDGSDQLERYITYYDRTENRLSGLNDYAQKRYSDIKQSVFINGSSNYFTLMSRFSRNWNNLTEAMEKKYNLYANENSDWSSQWILGTFIAIGVFVLVAILLNQLFFRLLLPKRFDTPEYRKKRPALCAYTGSVCEQHGPELPCDGVDAAGGVCVAAGRDPHLAAAARRWRSGAQCIPCLFATDRHQLHRHRVPHRAGAERTGEHAPAPYPTLLCTVAVERHPTA